MPRLASVGFLVWLSACPQDAPVSAPPPPSVTPLEMQWGFMGCDEVLPDLTCALRDKATVNVWVRAPSGRLRPPQVTHGHAQKEADVDGGQRWRVELLKDSGRIELLATDGPRVTRQHILLQRWSPPPDPWPSARYDQFLEQPPETVQTTFESLSEPAKSLAYMKLAIRAFASPDPKKARTRQLDWLKRSYEGFVSVGAQASSARVRIIQAEVLRRLERYEETKTQLAPFLEERFPIQASHIQAWNTLAAPLRNTGALRESLRYRERAARWAQRLGYERLWLAASVGLLDPLERIGASERAKSVARQVVEYVRQVGLPPKECRRRFALAVVYWWGLAHANGRVLPISPHQVLQDAQIDAEWVYTQLSSGMRHCPEFRSDAALNMALSALREGQPADAKDWLDRARRWGIDPWHEPWALDTEGRIALATQHPERAQTIFETMAERSAGTPEVAWASAIGLGLSAYATSNATAAWTRFEAAENMLDHWPGAAELERGFAGLLSRKLEAPRHLVGLLLAHGKANEALTLARKARSRALRASRAPDRIEGLSAEQKDVWQRHIAQYVRTRSEIESLALPRSQKERIAYRTAVNRLERTAETALRNARTVLGRPTGSDRLPSLASNELTLMLHPSIETWVTLASMAGQTRWYPLGPLDTDLATLERKMTEVLHREHRAIRAANTVRILAVGLANALDVHALEFQGRPLLASKPVFYGLDVISAPPRPPHKRALVVADPKANLRGAQEEQAHVAHRLKELGWHPHLAARSTAPTDLRRRLIEVDLFHFAGHASLGLDLNPGLELANNLRFTLSDVLSLPRAPRWIVLSGCETGVGPNRDAGMAVGLAHGFILTGSASVLATSRPVSDQLALALARKLYATSADPHHNWHRALQGLAQTHPQKDWAAYRIFRP